MKKDESDNDACRGEGGYSQGCGAKRMKLHIRENRMSEAS